MSTYYSLDLLNMKTWQVRRELTEKNRALEWNKTHPGEGLARLMRESLERDIRLIRTELDLRKEAIVAAESVSSKPST